MRFKTGKFRNRAAASAAGKRSQEGQAMKRMESAGEILRRPAAGTILRTIRIHDHVTQSSQEIQILQATRKNQIVAKCFGRSSRPHGWDWFMRHLRQRMVIRWLEL